MSRGKYLGEFEQIVLLSLARLKGEATGRRIFDELVAVTGREVAVAAVYITLARLEKKGHVRSAPGSDDGDGGRPLKVFRLEPAGAQALRDSHNELQRLWARARLHPELGGK
jgi:DNA-binding PadR family transcriptional regulator